MACWPLFSVNFINFFWLVVLLIYICNSFTIHGLTWAERQHNATPPWLPEFKCQWLHMQCVINVWCFAIEVYGKRNLLVPFPPPLKLLYWVLVRAPRFDTFVMKVLFDYVLALKPASSAIQSEWLRAKLIGIVLGCVGWKVCSGANHRKIIITVLLRPLIFDNTYYPINM